MNFNLNSKSEIFIPDNSSIEVALSRATHVAIATHSDDIEIMANHGIIECFDQADKHFIGILLSDSAGSPCNSSLSHDETIKLRANEQKSAAELGKYSAVIFLNYTSSDIKKLIPSIEKDLKTILHSINAKYYYLHSPFDTHETHIAASMISLNALRSVPSCVEKVYGCEVWGSLDWLPNKYKCLLDVSKNTALSESLLNVFKSQISGKRYDLATIGRRIANATFSESHHIDKFEQACISMDLTPAVCNPELEINNYLEEILRYFSDILLKRVSFKSSVSD